MSDTSAPTPRPVSLFTVVAVFVGFALFALVLRWFNLPASGQAPHNLAAQNLPADHSLDWKSTPATRRETLAQLQKAQHDKAAAYAWVDKKAGVVQLPIERAMQLVVQENARRK